ncbi:asparagine synthase-related protein [Tistrella mobilis]|uniref:asparagine synthetase B family protein n=1 Tax=Tistrella mobilis TaxID=171437 RepID=UPI00355762A6
MLATTSYRAPDGDRVIVDRSVALGRASLRSVQEAAAGDGLEQSGALILAGDVRLDGRSDLIDALTAAGMQVDAGMSDEALVLRAFACWDLAALDRIFGDFAVILWDGARRRLVAARDHYGVAQLYTATIGDTLLVSNSLSCMLTHPGADRQLDRTAVMDFLVLPARSRPDATIYRSVNRIPPGHLLVCEAGRTVLRRYWQPEPDGRPCVRFSPRRQMDAFRQAFDQAVADRRRWPQAGLSLSGGLDSTSIAARLASVTGTEGLRAYTAELRELLPDQEGQLARQVAARLKIPIEVLATDHLPLTAPVDPPDMLPPEPGEAMRQVADRHIYIRAARHSRIFFCGYGGDPLFSDDHHTAFVMPLAALAAFPLHAFHCWRISGLRPALRPFPRQAPKTPPARLEAPGWLVEPGGVGDRLAGWYDDRDSSGRAGMARAPLWPEIFQHADPDVTGLPLRVRHPFFDRRVIDAVSRVPARPWHPGKMLLRVALAGQLPTEILRRRKTPLGGDPGSIAVRRRGLQGWMEALLDVPDLGGFVDVAALRRDLHDQQRWTFYSFARFRRVWQLAYWLKWRDRLHRPVTIREPWSGDQERPDQSRGIPQLH